MKIKIDELKFDDKNARVHSDDNILALMKSIKEFGLYLPIVVNKRNNVVLVGNGTLEAVKRLGWTEIDISLVDLDENQADKLSVIDNRSAELSYFDPKIIEEFFFNEDTGLQELTGFNSTEIDEVMNKLSEITDKTEKVNSPNIECPYCKFKWFQKGI